MEICIREEKNITINRGSGMSEDEMFIGAIFRYDLSARQKIPEGTQQDQDNKLLNERFGIAVKLE